MKEFKFELGDEVQDLVTKFKGVIRSRADYLTGCDRYAVQSQKKPEGGKNNNWSWFDDLELKLVKKSKIRLVKPIEKEGAPITEGKLKQQNKNGGRLDNSQYAPR